MSQSLYTIVRADAVTDTDLSDTDYRILGLIGSFTSKDRSAWPSKKTLAELIGRSTSTVLRSIKRLHEKGYIHIERRYREDGSQASNLYHVLLQNDMDFTPDLNGGGSTGDTGGVSSLCNGGGSTGDTPLTITNRTITNELNNTSDDGTFSFSKCWELYQSSPSKAKSQVRKTAQSAFKTATKKISPELIYQAIEREVELRKQHADQKGTREFVAALPSMHRWLQQERFNDVLEEKAREDEPGLPFDDKPASQSELIAIARKYRRWMDDWGPVPDEIKLEHARWKRDAA